MLFRKWVVIKVTFRYTMKHGLRYEWIKMGFAPLIAREISLDHSNDWIIKCMAVLGLSVNPRVGLYIVRQENYVYVIVVVRLI